MPTRPSIPCLLLAVAALSTACSRDTPASPGGRTPSASPASAATDPNAPASAGTGSAGGTPSADGARTDAPRGAPPADLNVLLVSIDSLRADMPWTGYNRAIAPNLTRLAGESAVYENAYSVSSYTASYGVQLAHWLPRRKLEIAFAAFLFLVSLRFVISLIA